LEPGSLLLLEGSKARPFSNTQRTVEFFWHCILLVASDGITSHASRSLHDDLCKILLTSQQDLTNFVCIKKQQRMFSLGGEGSTL
jgi:hypothetical protein